MTFISYRATSNTKILKPLMQGLGWLKAELLMGDSLKGENKNERLKVNFWKQTTSSSRNDDDDAYWRVKINNVEYHNKRESARMFMLGWMEGVRKRKKERETERERERTTMCRMATERHSLKKKSSECFFNLLKFFSLGLRKQWSTLFSVAIVEFRI